MDTANLYQGLTFLAWTSVVFLTVIGVFIVKVLFDLSRLLSSMNKTADLVKNSAEPLLADVTESVSIISKYVKRADKTVNRFQNLSGKLGKVFGVVASKTSVISGLLFKAGWNCVKSFLKK